MARSAAQCAWCGKTPLTRLETAPGKKLLEYNPPISLCRSCLCEELDCDEEELRYLSERFREEGCKLFM